MIQGEEQLQVAARALYDGYNTTEWLGTRDIRGGSSDRNVFLDHRIVFYNLFFLCFLAHLPLGPLVGGWPVVEVLLQRKARPLYLYLVRLACAKTFSSYTGWQLVLQFVRLH
jgi:hypothetical protein